MERQNRATPWKPCTSTAPLLCSPKEHLAAGGVIRKFFQDSEELTAFAEKACFQFPFTIASFLPTIGGRSGYKMVGGSLLLSRNPSSHAEKSLQASKKSLDDSSSAPPALNGLRARSSPISPACECDKALALNGLAASTLRKERKQGPTQTCFSG
mmetsp:Transcript_66670/g.109720  ORF Transcript_66670/g.109720 Transcript_66670/m.109720 type:complete len:155 (+) Transcript_66670:325-789(+)